MNLTRLMVVAGFGISSLLTNAEACKFDNEPILTPEEIQIWLDNHQANKGPSQPQKITTTVNGLTFDSDYDNGSLESVSHVSGNEYDLEIYTENGVLGTRKYWFRFTIDGASGQTLDLNIDHSENPRPVVRFRDSTTGEWSDWRRTTAGEAPNNFELSISVPASDDLVELAFYFPLGMQETYDEVNALVEAGDSVTTRVAGQSFLGNDLWMVTVNDSSLPEDQKFGIWVHSRAHAGEVTSTHTMLGYLEQFLADDPIGERLRYYCRLDVMPLLNVDGTEIGYTRWDSQGIDPERQWCSPPIPSVQILKSEVDGRLASDAPPVVALNLHSTVGNFADNFFFQRNLGDGSNENVATQSFRDLLQDYVDAYDAETPLFDNLSPQFSNLRNCFASFGTLYIESYFWTNRGEETMAMTHEGHYYFRTGTSQYNTGEDHREMGRAQARALISFLNIPELPTNVDTWHVFE